MALADTRRTYHEQLDDLRRDVVRLAGMATESIARGTRVLLDADLTGVDTVIAEDARIDELTHAIEEHTYELLATQQPMASDLRVLVSTLRNIHEIERIGDLMVNIAKGARRLYPRQLAPQVRGILERMGDQAGAQLRVAADAFVDSDPAKAAALDDMDDVMDDLQKDLFRAIFSSGAADEGEVQRAVQTSLIGRYYERIADHAVNFGERVRFMVTGEIPGLRSDAEPDGGAAQ
ncbi:MAG TPA: phosphate signaling complex protein PhoU [Acidimicrobiia bacterium]|nr:phosphate signaling complex protein PhoU [Acidimicrobiia bacterium]